MLVVDVKLNFLLYYHQYFSCVAYTSFHFAGENLQLSGKTSTTSYWSPSSRDVIPATVPTDVYSRKVFVGGLPPDIDDGKLLAVLFCFVFLFVFYVFSHVLFLPLQTKLRITLKDLDL